MLLLFLLTSCSIKPHTGEASGEGPDDEADDDSSTDHSGEAVQIKEAETVHLSQNEELLDCRVMEVSEECYPDDESLADETSPTVGVPSLVSAELIDVPAGSDNCRTALNLTWKGPENGSVRGFLIELFFTTHYQRCVKCVPTNNLTWQQTNLTGTEFNYQFSDFKEKKVSFSVYIYSLPMENYMLNTGGSKEIMLPDKADGVHPCPITKEATEPATIDYGDSDIDQTITNESIETFPPGQPPNLSPLAIAMILVISGIASVFVVVFAILCYKRTGSRPSYYLCRQGSTTSEVHDLLHKAESCDVDCLHKSPAKVQLSFTTNGGMLRYSTDVHSPETITA